MNRPRRPRSLGRACTSAAFVFACVLAAAGCGDSDGSTSADSTDSASDGTSAGPSGTSEPASTSASTNQDSDGETTDTGATSVCPGTTPEEVMSCVEQDRYVADLEFIAAIRNPGSTHWQAVQDLCADRLDELGYDVTLDDYGTGVNVIGRKPGTDADADIVMVTAHYDHIPGCAGADDNATGVAATLEIARVLAELDTPRSLVIACWDEEELGLIGSKAYAMAASTAGEPIIAVFNLEMVGYKSDEPDTQDIPLGFDLLWPEAYADVAANDFRGDFLFWVSDDGMGDDGAQLETLAPLVGLPIIGDVLTDDLKSSPALSDLRRSDHAGFWDVDIPAMMLTDTSEFRYDAYHCTGGEDTVDRLDPGFSTQIAQVVAGAAAARLGL